MNPTTQTIEDLLIEFDLFFNEVSRVDIYLNKQIFFKKLEQSLKKAKQAGQNQHSKAIEKIRKEVIIDIIKNRETQLTVTGEGKHVSDCKDITGENWISIRELESKLTILEDKEE